MSQPGSERRSVGAGFPPRGDGRLHVPGRKQLVNIGKSLELKLQIGREGLRPRQRILNPFFTLCFPHATAHTSSVEEVQYMKLARSADVLPP